jgi:radical SAM superfamily enzyme YgiQ (UPF0313 family)
LNQFLSPVVFIAFEDFDNLGIGYLCAILSNAGYKTKLISFRYRKEEILKILKRLNPLITGFSVIFQHHIYKFRELISYLRKNGIQCHFTAGGHYASLRYEELFKIIPDFDSIVRFEGEYTILDLVKCIYSGKEWRKITGIVYKDKNKIVANPLRPLENDLDKFPFPIRSHPAEYAFDRKFATILAGRGCVHDCLFCNIKEYYKQSSGPNKRIRKPENVVKEMELLYREKDCSVFLFQDDDFPVKTSHGPDWIIKFCKELKRTGLSEKIMWKINCRPDEINEENFKMMKCHGLYLVFMGVEDGTDVGLKRLNKHITAAKNIEGINILKKLEIGFDFGFMIFQPWSTFRSINNNLDFLKQICGDGYTTAVFLKMLPYFATDIEKKLREEGRLKGRPGFLDYDFYEESLNQYHDFVTDCFMEWLGDPDGLANNSKWLRNYFSVYSQYFDISPEVSLLQSKVRNVISESNLFLLNTMKELSEIFESKQNKRLMEEILKNYREIIYSKHEKYKEQITDSIAKLHHFAGIPFSVF